MRAFLEALRSADWEVFLWTQAVRGHALRCMRAIEAVCGDLAHAVLSSKRLLTRGDGAASPKNLSDRQFAYSGVCDRLGRHPLPIVLDDNAAVALVWAVRSQPNTVQSPPFVFGADGWEADSFLLEMRERLAASHQLFFGRWDGVVRQFAAVLRTECATEGQYRAFVKDAMDLFQSHTDELPAMHQIAKLSLPALRRVLDEHVSSAERWQGALRTSGDTGTAEPCGVTPSESCSSC
jgi:hypothetical protein